MNENEIAKTVLDAAFMVHRNLGPGLLESVYEKILYSELTDEYRLAVVCQQRIPLKWKKLKLDVAFRADLVVENKVIIELKSVEEVHPIVSKQLLTYLKLTDCKLGLIINFNSSLLKDGVKRVVNNL